MTNYSKLVQLFGENRAEWPVDDFQSLFVTPAYHSKLQNLRPCVLVGGRGTGKTTSLRSLKYDSTLDRLRNAGGDYGDLEYLGVFVRMNKNRVNSFSGTELDEMEWQRAFAHYFNLLVCKELVALTAWLEKHSGMLFPASHITIVSREFGFEARSLAEIRAKLVEATQDLQLFVNNPTKMSRVIFSQAESPLRTFVELLRDSDLLGKKIVFCCIDEYENLLDYQQSVLNTYIKHAEPPLSYKIGVRKHGLRTRRTLSDQDLLRTPDDYTEIEIAEEGFEHFAKEVAEHRLRKAAESEETVPSTLNDFLEDLTQIDEAQLLGSRRIESEVLHELLHQNESLHAEITASDHSEIYFLRYWQEATGEALLDLAKDWVADRPKWKTRFGNYGYASLFWLSKGNKGARIKKYYSGSQTLLSLSGGNIRYFLELIYSAIGEELAGGQVLTGGRLLKLSARSQTLAATEVGRRKLDQLEGLADHGVALKRLVLGIGKVLFEIARNPVGRTPEVTSFLVTGDTHNTKRIKNLLDEGEGHLAFEAAPRTKPTSNVEIRDSEYRLHRIFCGFFEISHRKKRRMTFDAGDLIELVDASPAKAISSLLDGREQTVEQELPEQLALFGAFYSTGEKSDEK